MVGTAWNVVVAIFWWNKLLEEGLSLKQAEGFPNPGGLPVWMIGGMLMAPGSYVAAFQLCLHEQLEEVEDNDIVRQTVSFVRKETLPGMGGGVR